MLGYRIKTLRNKQGLTQATLGAKVGVSQRAIAHYESNARTPPLQTLKELAHALNTTVNELIDDVPDTA